MREFEVQFLVRVGVTAPHISVASNQTHIRVKAVGPDGQDPDVEIAWEFTKRWDDDGDVCEQWGSDGSDRRPRRRAAGTEGLGALIMHNGYAVKFELSGVVHVAAVVPEGAKAMAEWKINQFAVDDALSVRVGAVDPLPRDDAQRAADDAAAEARMTPVFAFATKMFGREPETNEDGEHVWFSDNGWSVELMQIYAVLGYATVHSIPVTVSLESPITKEN